VKQIVGGGPIGRGDSVGFEFEFADGTREKFHAAFADSPKMVSTFRGLVSVAERARRSAARPADMINSYQATGSQADRVGSMIVIRFPTADGIPLLVAVDDKTCERLQRELDRAMARPPCNGGGVAA
jgi:hypothetical protein